MNPDTPEQSLNTHAPTPNDANEQGIVRYGRPRKKIAVGRAKFTTMLQPELIKQLKRHAIDSGMTVADILERTLGKYLNKG